MRTGMFFQPAFPATPALPLGEVIAQILDTTALLDRLGFDEAWYGEHLTDPWEPVPAHDLVIAQAIQRTERITLCSGGYVIPYYHPASLAFRVMQLDHMARGRYVCGLAAGISPVDLDLVGLDAGTSTHREMFAEAVDILVRLWTRHVGHEWTHEGTFWKVRNSGPVPPLGHPHLHPYQRPHPPVAISAVSPSSSTAKLAGRHGFRMNSILLGARHLTSHWDAYMAGASETGIIPDRANWTIARDIFVAETDREARAWALRSSARTFWGKTIALAKQAGWIPYLRNDATRDGDDVDYEWLVDHHFIVGSPETVRARVDELRDMVGGFGTLLMAKYDATGEKETEERSLTLFQHEVVPGLAPS